MLERSDPLVPKLKTQYGVWAGRESTEFGRAGRRAGVPTIVAVAPDGTELQMLETERGPAALTRIEATAWPVSKE